MAGSPEITPADRIRELSSINADVAVMLAAAGRAINALTDRPVASQQASDSMDMTDEETTNSLDAHKQAFEQNATQYYTSLQAVVARLRRQAYALEEVGIIAPEASSWTGSTSQKPAAIGAGRGAALAQDTEGRITNGGLGSLDVGWLNSRGNKVGAEKEYELVQDAKELLEKVLSEDGMAGS